MTKIGRPTALIGYDTEMNVQARARGETPPPNKIIRPRTILYAVVIAIVGLIMVYALATRNPVGISALHDRNPVYVTLSDGSIRNAYTVRLLNKELHPRTFRIDLTGLPGAKVELVGTESVGAGNVVEIGPDQTRELRVLVTAPRTNRSQRESIVFTATDTFSGRSAQARDHFIGPERQTR